MRDHRFGRITAILTAATLIALGGGSVGAANYSIVPISPGGGNCLTSNIINSSRQVVGVSVTTAFSWTREGGLVNLGFPGGSFSVACAVNESGQVVGWSYDANGFFRAFSWTQAGGTVDLGALGGQNSFATAVNNAGQVVGYAYDANGIYRAFSGTQATGLADIGALGLPYSVALDVNELGQVVGYAHDASGYSRAFSWTQANGMMDLGTLPGRPDSFARAVNNAGQIVGYSGYSAFSWTQAGGMVDLGTLPGGNPSYAMRVNESGQVIGYAFNANAFYRAFYWTQASGMVEIGLPSGYYSEAYAINNAGQVVGYAYDASFRSRAFLWSADGGFVDLNDAVPTKPLGWQAFAAHGISDDGAIVVLSSTGLVLLVPEPLSVHAPVAGPVAANNVIAVGGLLQASASFIDGDAGDTHSATWNWGDGSTTAGIVSESNAAKTVTGSHVYALPGVYPVMLTITDNTGRSVQVTRNVVVYDPSAGFVTGGGWIQSPPGAFKANAMLAGRATFGFVSEYQKGANLPSGNTEFQFVVANLNFRSDTYEWLVVAGARAQFKGVGTINGMGEYEFILTAIDGNRLGGNQPDRFRLKLWYYDATVDQDVIVYDNQVESGLIGTSDEGNAVDGGSIVIHTK